MEVLIGLLTFVLFLFFQVNSIVGGDSGDLVTAAATFGNPHPPGYPLYTFFGYLLSRFVPFGTVAWRVTILSSVSSALTLTLVYYFVRRVTASRTAAVVSVLTLLGTYTFFFYSVTPEVFSLYILLVIGLFTLAYEYGIAGSTKIPWWSVPVLLGVSVSHHQFILFSFPAYIYLLFIRKVKHRKLAVRIPRIILGVIITLGSYLLPFVYSFAAGHGKSIVNWNRPVNVPNLIRLMTRADYGTFRSAPAFGESILQRLVNVKLYLQFLYDDFTVVGLLLAALGMWWLLRKNRFLAYAFIIHLFLVGPVFYFYASFPIVNSFMLGTFERFMLPTYLVIAVLIGIGSSGISLLLEQYVKGFFRKPVRVVLVNGVVVLIFLFALIRLFITGYQHLGIATDTTGDRFGRDMLTVVPDNEPSLVLLAGDTQFFITEYVRYILGVKPQAAIFHTGALGSREQRVVFSRYFPGLVVPDRNNRMLYSEIVTENYGKYRIFTNQTFYIEGQYYFVPRGLLYEVVKGADLLDAKTFSDENNRVFSGFQDLNQGILGRFNHMMLSDIHNIYALSATRIADILYKMKNYERALWYVNLSINYKGDSSTENAYFLKSQIETAQSNCNAALDSMDKSQESAYVQSPKFDYQRALIYRDCLKNTEKSQYFMKLYDDEKNRYQEPLPQVEDSNLPRL